MKTLKRHLGTFIIGIFALLFAIGCSGKSSQGLANEGDNYSSMLGSNPFEGGYSADSLNGSIGGLGGNSGLTQADQQALQNMTNGMADVNPQAGGGLPQDLLDAAKTLMDQENNTDAGGNIRCPMTGQQMPLAQCKMMLVGQIIQGCAEKVAPLAPIPGQPLMGIWTGGGACKVDFQVTATGPQPVYKVAGSFGKGEEKKKKAYGTTNDKNNKGGGQAIEGQMAAYPDGHGELKADPLTGTLSDAPQAGNGKLIHPTFNKTKSGASPCEVAVQLKQSTNPIPENYVEAMRRAGKCHRQALMFISPIMDNMFKDMDPMLANILMQKALGVSQ